MKLSNGHIHVLNFRLPAILGQIFAHARRYQTIHLLTYCISFTGLIVLSQLLTDVQSQQMMNLMCWVMVYAAAALALVSLINVLEGVLDL